VQSEVMTHPNTPREQPQLPKQPEPFLPTVCGCIITFLTIDSKSWWFDSGNLCLGLNGTVFQQAKGESFSQWRLEDNKKV
jgi:hypothetical protein